MSILDTLFTILRRTVRRQGVASADEGHLHHRLIEMGHGQRRAVLILWTWTALLSAFVLYPVFTGSGVSYVPIGAAMLGLVLFTVFSTPRSTPARAKLRRLKAGPHPVRFRLQTVQGLGGNRHGIATLGLRRPGAAAGSVAFADFVHNVVVGAPPR